MATFQNTKIKPFLDEYAKENNLPLYGTTKIGVIIKRKKLVFNTKTKRKFKRKPLIVRLKSLQKKYYQDILKWTLL